MSAILIPFPAARVVRDKAEQLAHAAAAKDAWLTDVAMRLAARAKELREMREGKKEEPAMEELAQMIADRVRAAPKRGGKEKVTGGSDHGNV